MVFHSFPEITMVVTPHLFLNPFSFLVRRSVAIPVATLQIEKKNCDKLATD